jgi:X-linked retinitis pigmentosa GTPase regulator
MTRIHADSREKSWASLTYLEMVINLKMLSIDDQYGQLGLCGMFEEKLITEPKICSFNVVIKSISCGQSHTAFISDSGHLYVMGDNSVGQLGVGEKGLKAKNTPTLVESLADYFVSQISCG